MAFGSFEAPLYLGSLLHICICYLISWLLYHCDSDHIISYDMFYIL